MKISTIIALSPLVSFVAAVPFAKRDLVWYTVTQQVIETMDIVTTIWLPAGGAEVTSTAVTTTEESVTTTQSAAQTSITSPVTSAAPLSSSESALTSTPDPAPEPTSSIVAAVAPEPSPSTTPAPSPPPTTTVPEAGSAVAGSVLPGATVSDLCTSGQTCVGDITFYNVAQGIGACGEMHENSEMVVAVSEAMMGSLSSGTVMNPLCGRSLSITDPSTKITQTAKVVDKCGGCTGAKDLDLSPSLFDIFYPETKGRASNIEWYWL